MLPFRFPCCAPLLGWRYLYSKPALMVLLSIPLNNLPFPYSNQAAASKLNSEAGDEFDHLQPHQQRSSSRQTFNRHSYLQQSPLTEETISLDDFDRRSLRSLQPKLIYTQEFSEGTVYILGQ